MRLVFTTKALKQYQKLTPQIHAQAQKQLKTLLNDLWHPSLHAKKYSENQDLWQARITRDWRMYFRIQEDTYLIIAIVKHPK